MNMFLAYIANVSDNLHNFAAVALFIGLFTFMWSFIPLMGERTIFDKYVVPNAKYIVAAVVVLFVVFLFTPSSWRHDMDMQYIQENSQLRRELNDMTIQLQKCEMKRGCYSDTL